MTRKSELLDDKVFETAKSLLDGLGNNAKGVIKLKAIIAAKEHGISAVSKIFNVARNTITSWIKILKDNPDNLFKINSGRGRKNTLTEDQLDEIKDWIQANSSITIIQLKDKIKNNFDVELKKSAIHKIMKKLSFSYITVRPKHYKQDTSQHEAFKKKDTRRNKK